MQSPTQNRYCKCEDSLKHDSMQTSVTTVYLKDIWEGRRRTKRRRTSYSISQDIPIFDVAAAFLSNV